MPATTTIVLVVFTLGTAVLVVVVIAPLRMLVRATLFSSVTATIVLVVLTLGVAVVVVIARRMVMDNVRLISSILHHVVHWHEDRTVNIVAETRVGRAVVAFLLMIGLIRLR